MDTKLFWLNLELESLTSFVLYKHPVKVLLLIFNIIIHFYFGNDVKSNDNKSPYRYERVILVWKLWMLLFPVYHSSNVSHVYLEI